MGARRARDIAAATYHHARAAAVKHTTYDEIAAYESKKYIAGRMA